MDSIPIDAYVIERGGGRLSVARRVSLGARLGLCPRRPLLTILGPTEVGEVVVSRRRLRGGDVKRPWTARPWRVTAYGPGGQPLGRALRFRHAEQAERCAQTLRQFAGHEPGL